MVQLTLLQVVLEDVNDQSPRFSSLPFAVVMPGSARGSTVAVAAAEDGDALSNGEVSYQLEQRGGGGRSQISLDVDRRTGRIFLSSEAPTHFETASSSSSELLATATVVATDGAAQAARRTSTATVSVLAGRADPGPDFTQDVYRVSVRENSPAGTPVGKVALVDAGGKWAAGREEPKFFLVGSESKKGRDRNLFEVDSKTGQV